MNEPANPASPTPPGVSVAHRAARGGLWVAGGAYANVAFGFVANLILTRMLAPDDFGVVGLASFFFALLNLRAKSGIGQALAHRRDVTPREVGTHLVLDVATGVATLALVAVAAPALRLAGYSWEVVYAVAALGIAASVESIMATAWIVLDKNLLFERTSLVSGAVFPLSYLPAFGLALAGAGFWSLLAQPIAYQVLLAVGMWASARRALAWTRDIPLVIDRQAARALLRSGLPIGLLTTVGVFLTQFDNFLVGTLVGLTDLGYYDRAYRIAQWPHILMAAVLTRAGFYVYAQLQDDRERLTRSVDMTLWLATSIAFPLALAIFAAAPDAVTLLYGERWQPSAPLLRYLVVFSAIRPIADLTGSLFTAVGRPKLALASALVETIVLIVAGVPLTVTFGATGTAFAVVVAFGLGLFVRFHWMRDIVTIQLWQTFVVPAAVAILVLAAVAALNRLLGTADWPLLVRVLVKGSFAAASFVGLLWLIQPAATRERAAYALRLLSGSRPNQSTEV